MHTTANTKMELITNNLDAISKPFLRWAGGKNWLIKHLQEIKKIKFNNYHEPFLGGGSIFFYLKPIKHSYLSDLNGDLIETFQAVQENAKAIIEKLKTFKNTEEDYYQIRYKSFKSLTGRAAKFIYLNQTSYNGIYRVNLKGIYNVPFGFRSKNFLDSSNLLNAQKCFAQSTLEKKIFISLQTIIKSHN